MCFRKMPAWGENAKMSTSWRGSRPHSGQGDAVVIHKVLMGTLFVMLTRHKPRTFDAQPISLPSTSFILLTGIVGTSL